MTKIIPSLFILAYRVVRIYNFKLPSYIPITKPYEMARENGEYPYYIEQLKKLHVSKFTVRNLIWRASVSGDVNLLIHIWKAYKPSHETAHKTLADLVWHLHVRAFILFHKHLDYPPLSYECMTACAFPRHFICSNKEDRDERVTVLMNYLIDNGVKVTDRTNRLASFCGNISYIERMLSDQADIGLFNQILLDNALSKGHLECALLLGSDGTGLKTGYSITGGVASMLLRVRENNLDSYNIALGFLDI